RLHDPRRHGRGHGGHVASPIQRSLRNAGGASRGLVPLGGQRALRLDRSAILCYQSATILLRFLARFSPSIKPHEVPPEGRVRLEGGRGTRGSEVGRRAGTTRE